MRSFSLLGGVPPGQSSSGTEWEPTLGGDCVPSSAQSPPLPKLPLGPGSPPPPLLAWPLETSGCSPSSSPMELHCFTRNMGPQQYGACSDTISPNPWVGGINGLGVQPPKQRLLMCPLQAARKGWEWERPGTRGSGKRPLQCYVFWLQSCTLTLLTLPHASLHPGIQQTLATPAVMVPGSAVRATAAGPQPQPHLYLWQLN